MISEQNTIAVKKYPYGTIFLVVVNVLFYFYICYQADYSLAKIVEGPGYTNLVRYGAKENGLIALGEVYRLILPMFMHANLVHLLVNMMSLWIVGSVFEFIVGLKNFFIVYLLAGITGNFCSFALIPNLSVGASGSLFGILFCLYIIQKYEEQLAREFKLANAGMKLGGIILVNVIINIVFGFSFPVFDWACHLGGSIAGVLFGLALTKKHRWNLNAIFTLSAQRRGPKKLFEYYKLYYFVLLTINILFSLSYFKIKNYQKVFGKAVEQASLNKTKPLSYVDLSQYKDILLNQNKETNSDNMFSDAIYLQNKGLFFPASKMYEILLILNTEKFGSDKFVSAQTKSVLESAYSLSSRGEHLSSPGEPSPSPGDHLSSPGLTGGSTVSQQNNISDEEICAKPAELFMTLGFYQISSKLYECAYILNGNNETFAVNAAESFYLANDEKGLNQILSYVNTFDSTELKR